MDSVLFVAIQISEFLFSLPVFIVVMVLFLGGVFFGHRTGGQRIITAFCVLFAVYVIVSFIFVVLTPVLSFIDFLN